MKHYTEQEKTDQVARVQALVKTGLGVKQACDEAKVGHANYYNWYKLNGSTSKQKPKLTSRKVQDVREIIPAVSSHRPICIILGQAEDINAVISKLGGVS